MFPICVFAQANKFEGFNAQVGVGYQNSTYQNTNMYSGSPSVGVYTTNKISQGSVAMNIGVGYTKAISDNFTLGAIIEYSPLNNSAGNYNYYLNGALTAPNDGQAKFNQQLTISLLPGMVIAQDTLGYLKFGYAQSNLDIVHTNGDPKDSFKLQGYLFGAGAKKIISGNLYIYGEGNYIMNNDKNWSLPQYPATGVRVSSAYNFIVGLGYIF